MDGHVKRSKRKWIKPVLQSYDLTPEELALIRNSDDPIRELLLLKPELAGSQSDK